MQPIASTSVIILVIYFAGFGRTERTLTDALANIAAYFLGGLWATVISLFLWTVDPFRPARLEVAACYDLLADLPPACAPLPPVGITKTMTTTTPSPSHSNAS